MWRFNNIGFRSGYHWWFLSSRREGQDQRSQGRERWFIMRCSTVLQQQFTGVVGCGSKGSVGKGLMVVAPPCNKADGVQGSHCSIKLFWAEGIWELAFLLNPIIYLNVDTPPHKELNGYKSTPITREDWVKVGITPTSCNKTLSPISFSLGPILSFLKVTYFFFPISALLPFPSSHWDST